jgi:hypothetical protein
MKEPQKKVRNGKSLNKNSVGKPSTRWQDVVQRDELQILGKQEWRRRAGHMEEWRRL